METELTTPKAILIGLSFMAVAIASIPYSKSVIGKAHAQNSVQRVQICGYSYDNKFTCVGVNPVNEWYGQLVTSK